MSKKYLNSKLKKSQLNLQKA